MNKYLQSISVCIHFPSFQGKYINPFGSVSDLSKVWGTTVIAVAPSCNLDFAGNVSDEEDKYPIGLETVEYLPEHSLDIKDVEKCANWCVLPKY